MALSETQPRGPVLSLFQRADPIGLSLVLLVLAPLWQLRFGVNGDASWIITMCERVLSGDRLYIDLIETNPPFTVWMFMPPVVLAHWLGVMPEIMVHLYTYAACVVGVALVGVILVRSNLPERSGLFAILPVIAALLIYFPGNSFAEREHLGAALLLPLLVLMAWRASGTVERPGLGISLAAGLAGSIIVLVKPYYAVMILVPALWVAWRRRTVLSLFAPEYLVIGLVSVAYLAAVLTFHPEFMSDIYPLLRDTYMRTARPLYVLKIYGPIFAILGFLIFQRLRVRPVPPLMVIALLAAVGGFLPLLYQGKGWAYHAYPALLLLLTALAYLVWQEMSHGARFDLVRFCVVGLAFVATAMPFQMLYRADAVMIEKVRLSAPANPGVALIGAGIEAGHPFTRLVDGRWIGAYCSDWLGGFATVWHDIDEANGETAMLDRYRSITETYIKQRSAELKQGNPDIVLLQKGDSIWTDPFLARPEMAGFMDRYDLLAEDYGVWVYLLKPEYRS